MSRATAGHHHEFFASCPRNTEGLLLDELRALGASEALESRAGVSFHGPLLLAYKACLWSRIASRVFVRLASFSAAGPEDIYEGVHHLPWEAHLDPRGTLAVEVTSTVRRGPLAQLNTHYAEQRVKDAVVDRFRTRIGTRPGVNLRRPSIRINLHLTPLEAVVSLDLSGGGLHRRGYRLEGGEAPLRENLAAAILARAGWPRAAANGGPLIDPMCGSGTFLTEGALMAADIAPGLGRQYFGFSDWLGFDRHSWDDLLQEAGERRTRGLERLPGLFGFDADPRVLANARDNIGRAGLSGRIMLEHQDIAALTLPEGAAGPPGLLIVNPPYGRRQGEISRLADVYETLGERVKESFSGWDLAVFTGNPELGTRLHLRAHRTNVFYNGALPCKLLAFHVDPATYRTAALQQVAARRGSVEARHANAQRANAAHANAAGAKASSSRSEADDDPGRRMFSNRLRKNYRHLRRWAAREGVTCYRLYDADLPEYAVAVDLYEDWAHVQEYEPPSTVDPGRARRRLEDVLASVPDVLQIPPEHVVLKVRRPQRGREQYSRMGHEDRFHEVEEGGLRFLVNLTDYLDTGLHLDHRLTRSFLRDLAPGRRFLNLFAYTGSATVYAAAGGAVSTTTLDLSSTYLDWARRNLALNGLSGPQHDLIRADCLEWLKRASGPHRRFGAHPASHMPAGDPKTAGSDAYDLIFLDAPTFSNSKSMNETLDIQRDHAKLVRAAASLLSSDGALVFSVNYRRFKLDPVLAGEYLITDITRQTIPPDFARNPRVHTCYYITPQTARPAEALRGLRAG